RVISGVILAAAALAAILLLPFIALRALAAIVAGLGAWEYAHMTRKTAPGVDHRISICQIVVVIATVIAAWWAAVPAPLGSVLLSLIAVAWLSIEVLREGRTLEQAAVDLVAPVYVGLPLGMLVALQMRSGPRATLLLIATIVVSDSAQYYTGRLFGQR